jgi:cell division protein FtsW
MSFSWPFTNSKSDFVFLKPRRHRPDYQMVLFIILLVIIGLIVIYAIGPQRANVLNNTYGSNYSSSYFFVHQLINIVLSAVAFCVVSLIPYDLFLKYKKVFLFIGIGSCVLLSVADVLGLSIAQHTLGATRWFSIAGQSIQPAEILKFGLLLYLSGFLGEQYKKRKINDVKETLIPVAIITAIAALFIIVLQKDFGTGASMFAIVVAMLIVSGIDKKILFMIVAGVAVIGVILMISSPHRLARIQTFLNGDSSSSDDSSYQADHAKMAIGSGGLLGVGVGNSVQATGYLPEAINDSIFAIMGEMFGFVGTAVIIALFTLLIMRILGIMDHTMDIRLRIMLAGIFGWLASHVMLNIGAMIGLIPLTGITLPLLSYGGTSMIIMSTVLGLAFQASRYTVIGDKLDKGVAENEDISGRRRVRGPRYSGRSGFSSN